jgi:parallel beta-helix repeat protein
VASSEAIPASARYVAPYGDDAAAGTADAPWRTLARAVSAVRPGDTVVLRSGVYGARGTVNLMNRAGTASAPISFRGEPGEPMPTILGFFKITGGHQHFDHLLFDGPTGPVQAATADNPRGEEVQVSVIGTAVDGVEITGSEIRDSAWHAGIFLSHANDVRVVGNYIHDNGDASDPGQANLSHGIYWSSGSGVIANNVVEHNLARGIQLYQSPSDARVVNNTVVGNGKAGIQFGDATARVTAANNVVVGNEYGIRSAGLTGTGNIARDNLLWANARGDLALADGLALSGNLIADPLFQGATDYRLTSPSPAVDRASAAFAPPADIGNRPRPLGAAPDLGAYESH